MERKTVLYTISIQDSLFYLLGGWHYWIINIHKHNHSVLRPAQHFQVDIIVLVGYSMRYREGLNMSVFHPISDTGSCNLPQNTGTCEKSILSPVFIYIYIIYQCNVMSCNVMCSLRNQPLHPANAQHQGPATLTVPSCTGLFTKTCSVFCCVTKSGAMHAATRLAIPRAVRSA